MQRLTLSALSGLALSGLTLPGAALAQGAGPQGNGTTPPDPNAPLSSVVAVYLNPTLTTIPNLVRTFAEQRATGTLPPSVQFPLANELRDDVGVIRGLASGVLLSWLDPLTADEGAAAPRFGSNCDYIAYFGEGWDADWEGDVVGSAPQFQGSGDAGWLWVNHEYISNSIPTPVSAPSGQNLTLAKFLADNGLLTNDVTSNVWEQADVDAYVEQHKRQLGGTWVRIERDAAGRFQVDRSATNLRFTATDDTLCTLTGTGLRPGHEFDHTDLGDDLPDTVVVGTQGNCSGGQSPWGTIFTAEENVQSYFGDVEPTWSSQQKFLPGNGFDPGAPVNPIVTPSRSGVFGLVGHIRSRHNRDVYGYLTEIDPSTTTDDHYASASDGGDGLGHRKVGAMGRARWENCCFAVGSDWQLVDGQPVVIYGGNDRRSGRIWKFVSAGAYADGMTRAQVRALLDTGTLYVAHFAGLDNATGLTMLGTGVAPTEAQPGQGRWIEVSLTSTDLPVNGAALGQPNITVGEALQDDEWNAIGGFTTEDDVRMALFTAATKLGVMELNRPEDLEYNANDPSGTPRIYVAFTKNGRRVANDQDGVLFDPATHDTTSPLRPDPFGAVFAIQEADAANPGASSTFAFFQAWAGTGGSGEFDAANPDNLMIDSQGGVWFGTDGNVGTNGTADALYYLDLDPTHKAGQPGVVFETFGKAFRVAAGPADSEATGPCLTSDEKTLFFSVQHPGESESSFPTSWPQ